MRKEDNINQYRVQDIILKFNKKRFEGLSLEDLAIAVSYKGFANTFQKATGQDWNKLFQIKAMERLNFANYDIHWLTFKTDNKFDRLFAAIEKNDLILIQKFIKENKNDPNLLLCCDSTNKSPLHISSINGNNEIVNYLLLFGYKRNARDKTLKTPLHYACMYGHLETSNIIINYKEKDPKKLQQEEPISEQPFEQRDSLGKNCFHHAVGSKNTQLIKMLLEKNKEFVFTVDNSDLTSLHYAVWNIWENQIEVLTLLIQYGADPNVQDSDGNTPLHHASSGGLLNAVKCLILNGADIKIKDYSNQKTPIQVAKDNKIRQAIVATSSNTVKDKVNEEDKEFISLAMSEKKKKSANFQEELAQKEIQLKINDDKIAPQINPFQEEYSPIEQFTRGRFYNMMRKLQFEGAKAWMHYKKIYLFTGTWFEKIESLEDLYQEVRDLDPCEVLIRCFNILCPYDQQLPKLSQNQTIEQMESEWKNFSGYKWYEGSSNIFQKKKMQVEALDEINSYERKIKSLQMSLDAKFQEIEQVDHENQFMKKDLENTKKAFNEQKITYEKIVKDLNDMIAKNTDRIQDFQKKNTQLQSEIKAVNDSLNKEKEKSQKLQKLILDKDNQNQQLQQNYKKTVEKHQEEQKQNEVILSQLQEAEVKKLVIEPKSKEKDEENESLVKLFASIYKSFPPTFYDRLKQNDPDNDNKLTKQEFQKFMESLQIEPENQGVLQRIAKLDYKSSNKTVGIIEFIDNCQSNELIEKIFYERVFFRILAELRRRNMTAEMLYKKLDTNLDGYIDSKELEVGLKTLKISLNGREQFSKHDSKDYNKIWEVFDKDHNNQITQQEFEDTLKQYQNYSPSYTEISFIDRVGIDKFDKSVSAASIENVANYNATFMHLKDFKLDINEDIVPLNGDLKVQIPFAADYLNADKLKFVYIKTLLLGSSDVEKANLSEPWLVLDNKTWNYCTVIPVRNVLKENINDGLLIQLYSKQIEEEEFFLGEVKIQWKLCLKNPQKWEVNHIFPLANVSYVKEKPKEVIGNIAVQCRWISEDSEEFIGQIQKYDLIGKQIMPKDFKATIVEDGILQVQIISCVLQVKDPKKGQVRCQVKIVGSEKTIKEEFYAKLDAKKNPYWGEKFDVAYKPKDNAIFQSVQVDIELDPGSFKKAILMGQIFVEWGECLNWPGQYLTKKAFLFQDKSAEEVKTACKFYTKIRWIPHYMFQQLTGFSQLSEKEKLKQIEEAKDLLIKGVLKINVLRAKNLRAEDGDSADPYAVLTFESFKNQKLVRKTNYISSELSPQWNERFKLDISFVKDAPVPPLSIQLFDHDVMPGGDDPIGECVVDLTPAVDHSGEWAINDLFDVNDPEYGQKDVKPQIYIQAQFILEGTQDNNTKPEDKEGIIKNRDDDSVSGTLKVRIVHAREIKKADRTASDPFAIILFPPPEKKEHKTSIISNTLNPIWNESFSEKVKVSKANLQSGKIPIRITVKDSDFGANDDILGYCNVDWEPCIKKAGEWGINNIFELQGEPNIKGDLKTLGFIYVQMKFLEEGMIDDDKPALQIENLADMLAKQCGMYKGTLRVFLVHCENLVKADSGDNDFSDPFCLFKLPGGKQVNSVTIQNNNNPVWEIIYPMPIAMPMNMIQPLRVEVLDSDLIGNELLGYVTINLEKCFEKPQTWGVNEIFSLDGSVDMKKKFEREDSNMGKIYVQIMFVQEGVINDDKPLPLTFDLNEKQRKELEEKKKPLKGVLIVNIPMARGLKAADSSSKTSDPFVEIYFPAQKKPNKTQVLEKNLDPIWNYQSTYRMDILKEQYQKIKFAVMDHNGLLSNEPLGTVEIDWMPIFDQPQMWLINEVYKLQGEKKKGIDLGEIYIQMKFMTDDQVTNAQKSKSPQEIEEEKKQENKQLQNTGDFPKTEQKVFPDFGRIMGQIELEITSASGLPNMDTIGKSDPYVKAFLSLEPQKCLRTLVIKDNEEPVWNFKGIVQVNLFRCQVKRCDLVIEVWDEDNVNDELMCCTEVDILDIIEKEYKEIEYDDNLYEPKVVNSKRTPKGSIKFKYKWVPSIDCESIKDPYIRQPENIVEGDIFIKVVNCSELKDKECCVEYWRSDDKKKTKFETPVFKQTLKRKNDKDKDVFDFDINKENIYNISIGERKIPTLNLQFQIYDGATFSSNKGSVQGGFTIPIRNYIEIPGKWYHEYTEILNDKGQGGMGYCFVLIQFRTKDDKTIDIKEPPVDNFITWKNKDLPPTFKGKLYVNIVGAKNLKDSTMDTPDPFAEVMLSKGQKNPITTKRIDDIINPVWNHVELIDLNLNEKDWEFLKIICKVWDYNYSINGLLGKVEVPIKDLFYADGKWDKSINQIFPLLDSKDFPGAGFVYLQFQWQQEGMIFEAPTPKKPENLFEKELNDQKKKQEEKKLEEEKKLQEPKIQGILYLKIVQAKGLIKANTFSESDGFCEIKINKGASKMYQSEVKKNNKDPVWDQGFDIALQISESEFSAIKLSITVYNHELISNTFLGYIELDLDAIMIKEPGKWLNQIYQLLDQKSTSGQNGLIYIQLQWRQDKKEFDKSQPEKLEINSFYHGACDPKGTLVVKVVGATNILGVEKKGTSSDAKLIVYFGNNKEKTKVISSLNPVWNQFFYFNSDFKDVSQFPFLKCDLFDDNFSSDAFLGDFEENILEALQKPNTWAIKKSFPVADLKDRLDKKLKNNQTGNVELWIGFARKGQDDPKKFESFQ